MVDEKIIRAAIAGILNPDERAQQSPSEEILKNLDDHIAAGDLRGFAETFCRFARERRPNLRYVESTIPAKVLNQYLLRQPDITSEKTQALVRKSPGWAQELKDAVWSPLQFEMHVEALANEVAGTLT